MNSVVLQKLSAGESCRKPCRKLYDSTHQFEAKIDDLPTRVRSTTRTGGTRPSARKVDDPSCFGGRWRPDSDLQQPRSCEWVDASDESIRYGHTHRWSTCPLGERRLGMADTRLVDDHGNVYKSWAKAQQALQRYPRRTFYEESLSMEGTTRKDVTDELERRLQKGMGPL